MHKMGTLSATTSINGLSFCLSVSLMATQLRANRALVPFRSLECFAVLFIVAVTMIVLHIGCVWVFLLFGIDSASLVAGAFRIVV